MEDRQGKRSSKTSIIKGLQLINSQMDYHLVVGETRHYHQETNCKSPTIIDRYTIMNHYASSTSGSNSFSSRGAGSPLSPLSAIENLETPRVRSPQIYGTPVKVDEEVIVMDGILISLVPGGAKTVRSLLTWWRFVVGQTSIQNGHLPQLGGFWKLLLWPQMPG